MHSLWFVVSMISFFGLVIPFSVALASEQPNIETPSLNDSNLRAELVVEGLKTPTSIAFLGPDDIIVLEKNPGLVKRVLHGQILNTSLLDVEVANQRHRGLLGIAIAKQVNENKPYSIFLYYTESSGQDGNDKCPKIICERGNDPKGNRLYKYVLNDQGRLVNPELLLDLPATPGAEHIGGLLKIGSDNNLYLISGDGFSCSFENADTCKDGKWEKTGMRSQRANVKDGLPPDGRGGILRMTQTGDVVGQGILGNKYPLNLYYGYGIRNGFGMDFDPVSGKLWDTENGPSFGDEINLVEPGFNSGWLRIQGMWPVYNSDQLIDGLTPYTGYIKKGIENVTPDIQNLVDFGGKGKYSDPEFVWNQTVGVTGLKFLNSDKLGKNYENDMFVGDLLGNIYHFDLTADRTALKLHGSLRDKLAESSDQKSLQDVIFGKGFGSVTDLEVGPDGYLYVVSIWEGKIFRIVPKN
jgi:glucose/arabinose dehydrogenase